jgi:hypothetical protein
VPAQALLGRRGEAVEVGPPHANRDQQREGHREDQLGAEVSAAPGRGEADRHDRFPEADDHEQAVALGEMRHRDALKPSQTLAGEPRRPAVVDRDRNRPEDVSEHPTD